MIAKESRNVLILHYVSISFHTLLRSCRRSVVCYCRPSTLGQSTCWRPVCLVTRNISSEA